MKYKSIQLNEMIGAVGEDAVQQILADFSCPLNNDIEFFMKNKALEFEKTRLARTTLIYAVIDANSKPVLVAFYSLALSTIKLAENLKRNDKRRFFGTTYPLGKSIKSILIGQLSKNYANGHNHYISGNVLMGLVFDRIKQIDVWLSSTIVHIDCKDDPNLKHFYEKHGFQYYQTNGDLLSYVIPTKKIIEADYINEQHAVEA